MKKFNDYVQEIKENSGKLRLVKVTFDDGDYLHTHMAAHISDDEIREYYKIGKTFNVGLGPDDNMKKIAEVDIIE